MLPALMRWDRMVLAPSPQIAPSHGLRLAWARAWAVHSTVPPTADSGLRNVGDPPERGAGPVWKYVWGEERPISGRVGLV